MSPYSLRATTGSPLISIASLSFLHVPLQSIAIQCLRNVIRQLIELCLSNTMDWTCPPSCRAVARSCHFVGGKPCFSMRYAALLVVSGRARNKRNCKAIAHYLSVMHMQLNYFDTIACSLYNTAFFQESYNV